MMSASHSSTQRNLYPVTIDVMGLPTPYIAHAVMGAELAQQQLVALLGRDALQTCTLFYNGIAGQVTLHR